MTDKTHTAHYVGGPLNGQAEQLPGGHASNYRDDDGVRIPAAKGDREVIHRHNAGKDVRRFYVHQFGGMKAIGPDAVAVHHLYVYGPLYVSGDWDHGTTWAAISADNR